MDNFEIITTCYVIVDNTIENDSSIIFEVVEQMPEFPGGIDSLFSFLKSEIRLPNPDDYLQCRVICRFVVEKDGSIGQIEVLRKVTPWFDNEAIRVIRSMPKWIPGKQNGKVVRVWNVIPISFKYQ